MPLCIVEGENTNLGQPKDNPSFDCSCLPLFANFSPVNVNVLGQPNLDGQAVVKTKSLSCSLLVQVTAIDGTFVYICAVVNMLELDAI